MGSRAFWLLVGGVALASLSVARPANATKGVLSERPPPARCKPVTTRSEAEILTPLRSPAQPELPERAVVLMVGENLCLSGPRLVTGQKSLEPIELVGLDESASSDERGAIPALLHVSLARLPDGSTLLSVQNDTPRFVQLRVLLPLGASEFLVAHRYLRAAPFERTFLGWDVPLERVALFDFKVEQPSPYEEAPRLRGRQLVEREGSIAGLGLVGYFGVMPLHLDALSSELSRGGYAAAPSTQALGGAGFWFSFWRLRLDLYLYGGESSLHNRTTDKNLSLDILSGGISAGWEVLRYRSLAIYPYAGIAAGTVALNDVPARPFPVPSLRPTPNLERDQALSTGGAQLDLGVAFDQLVVPLVQRDSSYLGLILGMKVGYNVALTHRGWSSADDENNRVDYRGGPKLDLGGPYAVFSAGFALRSVDF